MSPRRDNARVDSGNVPENPLRPFRMAMLSHGFVPEDESRTNEMRPDKNESLTYSVVPLRSSTSPVPALITLAVLIAGLTIGILLFG